MPTFVKRKKTSSYHMFDRKIFNVNKKKHNILKLSSDPLKIWNLICILFTPFFAFSISNQIKQMNKYI